MTVLSLHLEAAGFLLLADGGDQAMTNSSAQENPATKRRAASVGGPVARELAKWLELVREGWTQSSGLNQENWSDKKKRCFRLGCALSGSIAWLGGTAMLVLGDPRFLGFVDSGWPTVFLVVVLMIFALWIGWLVAYADRKAGPVRLFLDGLLLPAVTIAVISLSSQWIESARFEPKASSESTGVKLQPPNTDEAESAGKESGSGAK